MINIVVNCNSDELVLNAGYKDETRMKVKNPTELIKVLEEVLNCVGSEFYTYRMMGDGIRLSKIDEDTEITIEEW